MKLSERQEEQQLHAELDERLIDVIRLLGDAPLDDVDTILDIGAGKGQVAKILANHGKKVTCTGVSIDSYVSDVNALREYCGIEYVECDVEHMPFPDGSYDAVLMSHVLEHCPNVSLALRQVHRVLRENGLLLVFVPPQENVVCAGHVSVGWNIGQLMYVLILNGFDVRGGNFIEYGYNVCGFVRRTDRALPKLRSDSGDIAVLVEEGFFPLPIVDGVAQDYFHGNIESVNWPTGHKCKVNSKRNYLKSLLLELVDRALPLALKLFVGNALLRAGRVLTRHSIKTM